MKIKKKEKAVLGVIFWAAFVSGFALFVLAGYVRVPTAAGMQHHPAEQSVRAVHTALTYLVVLGLGYLVKSHILPGLKSKKQLTSGVMMISVFGILILTALGIFYSGESHWSTWFIRFHDWVGLLLPAMITVHASKRLRRT